MVYPNFQPSKRASKRSKNTRTRGTSPLLLSLKTLTLICSSMVHRKRRRRCPRSSRHQQFLGLSLFQNQKSNQKYGTKRRGREKWSRRNSMPEDEKRLNWLAERLRDAVKAVRGIGVRLPAGSVTISVTFMSRYCKCIAFLDCSTMNSLYTSGVRQTSSIQADLERLRNGDTSASLLGTLLLPRRQSQLY